MTKVNLKKASEGGSYYLPHHDVLKPESPSTGVKFEFNTSSQTSYGLSLKFKLSLLDGIFTDMGTLRRCIDKFS